MRRSTFRVAEEPNRNRKPEPSEPFFPKPKAEPEPPEPFSRNRNWNRNRPLLLSSTQTQKTLFAEEPPEPKTGTGRTVLPPNRSRTEPNRGHPALFSEKKKTFFSEKGGGNSVNEGLGKDFYRKGNSVKRSGPVSEPPDSENCKVAVLIPFNRNSALKGCRHAGLPCHKQAPRKSAPDPGKSPANGSC